MLLTCNCEPPVAAVWSVFDALAHPDAHMGSGQWTRPPKNICVANMAAKSDGVIELGFVVAFCPVPTPRIFLANGRTLANSVGRSPASVLSMASSNSLLQQRWARYWAFA
jgi:hypothetical protein